MTMLSRHWTEPYVEAPATQPSAMSGLWSRASRRIVATSKKVFPAIVVIGGCATLVAATIALRLAIWLPLHFHP